MLRNKVVVVTGGSRGIGRAIACEAAENGADIAVIYCGNIIKAEETANLIKKLGRKCEIYQCDISDFKQTENVIKKIIQDFNKIDVLINNAGINRDSMLLMMKCDDFDKVIDTDLKGVFNTSRHVIKNMMKRKEGCIINISSVSGLMGNPGQANYSAAKAGVIGFSKTVAKEFAKVGIRCNCIAPGFIKTDMTDSMSEDIKENIADKIPVGFMGTPEDISGMAVYLASDKARYITGEVIRIDGGLYI